MQQIGFVGTFATKARYVAPNHINILSRLINKIFVSNHCFYIIKNYFQI